MSASKLITALAEKAQRIELAGNVATEMMQEVVLNPVLQKATDEIIAAALIEAKGKPIPVVLYAIAMMVAHAAHTLNGHISAVVFEDDQETESDLTSEELLYVIFRMSEFTLQGYQEQAKDDENRAKKEAEHASKH